MEAMARILMKMTGIMLWLMVLIAMAVGEDVKYKDPKQPVAVRIKDLMSRMTLEEKIGQMVQIDRLTASPDIMQTYCIGNI
jgi:predicted metalloprotease